MEHAVMTINNPSEMTREQMNRSVAEFCANGTKGDLIMVFESCPEAQKAYYDIQRMRMEIKAWEQKNAANG